MKEQSRDGFADYIKKGGTEGLAIRKSSGSKPRITDKDREIILCLKNAR
jgi:hypothetical protein